MDLTDAVEKKEEAKEAEERKWAAKIASPLPFTDDEDEETSESQPSQPSPIKTPDADYDEEQSPGSSDSEAEHEEAKEALKGLQELLDGLDRRIQASEVDKSVTKDVLLRAQMMIKQEGDGGVRRHAATSQRDPSDALTSPEPRQPREFMEEKGYDTFDELKDGDSLVILCCRESRTRQVMYDRSIRISIHRNSDGYIYIHIFHIYPVALRAIPATVPGLGKPSQ